MCMVLHMTDLNAKIAWAAGLFEGEGNILARPNKTEANVSLVMQVGMTDLDVLERFHSYVFEIGKINGPYGGPKKLDGTDRKVCWRWMTMRTEKIILLVELFRPWLGVRRIAQAESAIMKRYKYESETTHFNMVPSEFPSWVTGSEPVL